MRLCLISDFVARFNCRDCSCMCSPPGIQRVCRSVTPQTACKLITGSATAPGGSTNVASRVLWLPVSVGRLVGFFKRFTKLIKPHRSVAAIGNGLRGTVPTGSSDGMALRVQQRRLTTIRLSLSVGTQACLSTAVKQAQKPASASSHTCCTRRRRRSAGIGAPPPPPP
jgi:hypothetical protein